MCVGRRYFYATHKMSKSEWLRLRCAYMGIRRDAGAGQAPLLCSVKCQPNDILIPVVVVVMLWHK